MTKPHSSRIHDASRNSAPTRRSLRIAFVTGAFPKLSETFVQEQIVGLLELGHDVRIYAFEDPAESQQHADVERHRLLERTLYLGYDRAQVLAGLLGAFAQPHVGLSALRHRDALGRRLAHGVQGEFDVIYCHFGHVAERARQLRRAGFFGGPLVAVFHGADMTTMLDHLGEDAYAALFREAARLLPISEYWRQKLLALGAAPAAIEVRHMGVACDRIDFRPELRRNEQTLRILSVGRFVEKKGFEEAIHAIALAERTLGRKLHYGLVGDGPLRKELEAAASAAGIRARVTFHGALTREAITPLLDGADLLLAPSVTAADGDMEGIPVILMEAMAQGLPVVSTRHSGIPELVQAGENGWLVPERDRRALADAVVDAVSHPERCEARRRAARRTVELAFDSRPLIRELATLFASLAEERR